ncbi:MAG: hypothetical protein H6536_09045 [Bacteroidales bacterium]|nr:hypothetical protein [Bacteroidales bacterium]
MKHNLLLILLSIAIILSGGCASKKYAKRGSKFEQAGLWEQAAESYMRSLSSKRHNIDAIVGLKRSGQKVIDDRCYKIYKAYESDQFKETVYGYLGVVDFKNRAAAYGVELTVSDMATDYFKDAKPKYIEKIYAESQQLMDAERFEQAENVLKEIQLIDPNYGNVQEMLKVSKCEPLYRQAREYMGAGLNRKAYANFDKIIKEHNSYKDSKELKDEALLKALITIKVENFENEQGSAGYAVRMQGTIVSQLNSLKNPFLKVVDTDKTQDIIDEQRRSVALGSDIQVGKILAANAILTGSVVEFRQNAGKLAKNEKRGYLKIVKTVKNKATGQDEKQVSYQKAIYYTYSIKNSVTVALRYQLASVETGAVMVSDVTSEILDDEARYATFDGDGGSLVPGYWVSQNKNSAKDYVSDNPAEINALQSLLKAKRNVLSVNQLLDKATAEISAQVVQKINKYNPEQ